MALGHQSKLPRLSRDATSGAVYESFRILRSGYMPPQKYFNAPIPKFQDSTASLLIFIQILLRDIVFLDFVCPDFALIGIGHVFHTLHYFRFEGVPLLEQFVHTL
jgi:hypothetical protein